MSDVTRSMQATTSGAVARVSRARLTTPSGWWGMALFVATEATLFGTLIASYYYLRLRTSHWPPTGVEPPEVLPPIILTAILVATTIPMVLAVSAARSGYGGRALLLLLFAALIQGGYFGVQVHYFLSDLAKVDPRATAYGSVYFTMLGLHHLHVALGVFINLFVVSRLARGLTNYRLIGVRVAALYWYFVNALALVVLATQLSPRW